VAVDDYPEHHPGGDDDGNDEGVTLSLDDLPALPADVRLRVLANALDPDAPPAPLSLLPADPPGADATDVGTGLTAGSAAHDDPSPDELASHELAPDDPTDVHHNVPLEHGHVDHPLIDLHHDGTDDPW
jgi:hypothetical protein